MGCVLGTRAAGDGRRGIRRRTAGASRARRSIQQPSDAVQFQKNGVERENEKIRHTVDFVAPDRRKSRPEYSLKTAQGWPPWLSAVAGDVIKDWTPRRANTFEKLDKIGQGTYSNVYKARDLITGKIVALKKVRFDNLEPESVKFMAREILVLSRLNHPNVIKLEGLVTSRMSCSLYLVFEYMEHDLAGLAAVQGVKFTEPQVKCYMKQLLSGLEHCHKHGVFHRDSKGSNLLIDNEGILKIADFGLASFYDPEHKQPMTSRVVTKGVHILVKCYMKQLLSGLEHCHKHGVLHRDIKGSNLLIDNEGILKIADFGLASFYDPEHKQPMTSRVVTLWYRPPELLLGATYYGVGVDLWSAGCILGELLAGKPIMPGRTEVEQLHKIFKLCGSPSEEYWKKSRLPNATLFKPQQPYKRRTAETFKDFPPSSLPLVETLLSIDPEERGSATAALNSEFFTTEPYACEPSSLPKYPPSKEMDVKLRDEAARRQRGLSGKANVTDGARRPRVRDRGGRAVPAPEANAELQSNLNRWRVVTQANGKSKSEKFPPPHQDAAVGFPRDESHNGPVSFGPHDTSFNSSIFDPKSLVSVKSSDAISGPSKRRKPKREEPMAPSRRFIRSFIPSSIGLAMDLRFKGKESVSEGFGSRR